MKKYTLFLALTICAYTMINAQVIFTEDFEGVGLPADWSQNTLATDGGWNIGSPADLSSQYWTIPTNGSTQIAATNDDDCNCNKSQDYLITPRIDLTSYTGVAVSFDMFFGKSEYQGFIEQATIEVSTDGVNWSIIADLSRHSGWHTHHIDLSDFAGMDSVWLAFHYNDNGGFLYGWAIDNVSLYVPLAADAGLTSLKLLRYSEVNVPMPITGTLINYSLFPITQMEISYAVDGGTKDWSHLHGLNIQPFESYTFHTYTPWTPLSTGIYTISVEIETVNNKADDDPANDVMTFETEVFPHVITANRVDEFLDGEPVFTTIATSSDGLDKPTDLDYFPILAKNELWVINERVESSGGSTTTLYNTGTPEQESLTRVDGNAWHFMSLPTGIAFSNNFNFANSTGVKDANHSNGTFTGPALWSSDPAIYAQPSGGNGSHLDMQHASPYCMGIANEVDNVFWVTDGWNGHVVRYDFVNDHGPGNDDHADGIVRRYTQIAFKKDGVVPSHLVLDKEKRWMYVVDNGNDRVVRLDITTGEVVDTLPLINEPLAEHTEIGNVTWEVIIDSLVRPSGIDIIENRLLVGDYTTGDIIIYDVDNGFAELGRISTGQEGLTGIKVAPDGSVYYTNRLQNSLVRAEPGAPTSVVENGWLNDIRIAPNPTSGLLYVEIPGNDFKGKISLELTDATGKKQLSQTNFNQNQPLDLSGLVDGIYFITVWSNEFSTTKKLLLRR